MPVCHHRLYNLRSRVLFAACAAAIAGATPVAACQDEGEQRRHIPCGKSHVAAADYARPAAPMDDAYREAMADTDVLHYELDIEASNLNTTTHQCRITGTNRMTIQSKSTALAQFSFRLRSQFTITGSVINDTTPVNVSTVSTTTRVVALDRLYGMNEIFTLTIEYDGTAVADGPWSPIYVSTQPGAGAMVSSMSCPYFSYTWWPVKDGDAYTGSDHSDKVTMDFSITVPENLVVPANGLLEGTETLGGGRKRYNWSTDYAITPYLVCFAGAEYNNWTVYYDYVTGSMPVEFYIYPAWDTAANREAWEEVVGMIEVYADLFGEYPFIDEKYGIYNAPFGGGMEHQTMTAQGGGTFAFDEYLTAHELSHMWWGDMITCQTWNHVWLNEGFASYAEALWAEFKPGSSGLPALKSYMTTMRYTGAGTIYVSEAEVGDLYDIFDGYTSYNKGAWVVHMLRHVLGDENFFDALASYRSAYAFGAATTEDFQGICEAYYPGGDLDWFFQEWIYGERTPTYSWGWDSTEVNGQHYLLVYVDQTQSSSYQRFTMPIDVVADGETYVVFNDADPEHFVIPVPSAPSSVSLDPDAWILWYTRSLTTYVPGPPKIVEVEPAPGAIVDDDISLDTVTVTFHTNVNVTPSDFSLVGRNHGPQSFTIASTSDVNTVVLDLDGLLPADVYTLRILAEGVVSVASGMVLDGEIDPSDPDSLPSGDGVPGGNALIRFSVAGEPIPAVSEWGAALMTLLVLTAGTLVFTHKRQSVSCP